MFVYTGKTATVSFTSARCHGDEERHNFTGRGPVSQDLHSETWKRQVCWFSKSSFLRKQLEFRWNSYFSRLALETIKLTAKNEARKHKRTCANIHVRIQVYFLNISRVPRLKISTATANLASHQNVPKYCIIWREEFEFLLQLLYFMCKQLHFILISLLNALERWKYCGGIQESALSNDILSKPQDKFNMEQLMFAIAYFSAYD